jgi:hypothetical protein
MAAGPLARPGTRLSDHLVRKDVYKRTSSPIYYPSVTDPQLSRAIHSVTNSIF